MKNIFKAIFTKLGKVKKRRIEAQTKVHNAELELNEQVKSFKKVNV